MMYSITNTTHPQVEQLLWKILIMAIREWNDHGVVGLGRLSISKFESMVC
jgi:hypothetical protein